MTKDDRKLVTFWAVLFNFPTNSDEKTFLVEQKNGEMTPRIFKTYEAAAEMKAHMIRSGYSRYRYKVATVAFYAD